MEGRGLFLEWAIHARAYRVPSNRAWGPSALGHGRKAILEPTHVCCRVLRTTNREFKWIRAAEEDARDWHSAARVRLIAAKYSCFMHRRFHDEADCLPR